MDNNAVNSSTYIHILINTLTKKNQLLDKILQITLKQDEYIAQPSLNMELFNQSLSEKELLIEQLNQLDNGFEQVYDHVKEELSINKTQYKDEILQLQDLIKLAVDKSMKLQATEKRNKNKLQDHFYNQKIEIKNLKKSNQMASSYYKNMANHNLGDSYFLDQKK